MASIILAVSLSFITPAVLLLTWATVHGIDSPPIRSVFDPAVLLYLLVYVAWCELLAAWPSWLVYRHFGGLEYAMLVLVLAPALNVREVSRLIEFVAPLLGGAR